MVRTIVGGLLPTGGGLPPAGGADGAPAEQCDDKNNQVAELVAVHEPAKDSGMEDCQPGIASHFEKVAGAQEASWWAAVLLDHLKDLHSRIDPEHSFQLLWGCRHRYASDCSGADAPHHALEQVRHALQAMYSGIGGIGFSLVHEFASECPSKGGEAARKFLSLNARPRVLFDDMTSRGVTGTCHFTKKQVSTPTRVDFYTAGFVCVDGSSENMTSKKAVRADIGHDTGLSTRTLVGAFEYIRIGRPETYMLENPYKRATLEALFTAAARVPDYAFAAVVINSTTAGLPASRPRMYFIGVDLRSRVMLLPFSEWVAELQKIFARFRSKAPSTESYVLPSSAEAVRDCRIALAARRARGQHEWPKEKKKHQAVRRVLTTVRGFKVPPLIADTSVPGMISHQWFRLLPDRMQDVAAVYCRLGLSGVYLFIFHFEV